MDYKRVLTLHFTNGMSSREIAATTGDGKSAVSEFLKRFRECSELSYPLSEDVTNEFIAGLLYKKAGNLVNGELYRDFYSEEVRRALAKNNYLHAASRAGDDLPSWSDGITTRCR